MATDDHEVSVLQIFPFCTQLLFIHVPTTVSKRSKIDTPFRLLYGTVGGWIGWIVRKCLSQAFNGTTGRRDKREDC